MIEGGLTLPTPAEGEAALDVTHAWLRDPQRARGSGSPAARVAGEPDQANNLPQRLGAAGLADWREAMLATLRAAEEGGEAAPPVRWLMAQAAVEVAVVAELPELFQLIDELQAVSCDSDADLMSAVLARLHGAGEDHPFLGRLSDRLQAIYGSVFYEQVRRYAEATAEEALRTHDLWSGHIDLLMNDGWAHQVAARLWPVRYLELLASYPAPLQHAAILSFSPLDPTLAGSLISASPPAFSLDGSPLGPAAVFAVLETMEAYLERADLDSSETTGTGLDRTIEAMLLRGDSPWIARAWLQQVIWRGSARRAGRSAEEVAARQALRDALIGQLSARTEPLGDAAFNWIRAEEPLWQVDRVLVEASILDAHAEAAAAAEILAGAVRQGLVTATGRGERMASTSAEAIIVGHLLANLGDVQTWFEALWRDTYELREQLSFAAYRNLDNPAYPALTWGLTGLNATLRIGSGSAALWQTLANAVFETQLIDPNARIPNVAVTPITRATVQLGAALVEAGVLEVHSLAGFLREQLEPSTEHARLWRLVRSVAADATALQLARAVGASPLGLALEAGLSPGRRGWDAALDADARADLLDFARRL